MFLFVDVSLTASVSRLIEASTRGNCHAPSAAPSSFRECSVSHSANFQFMISIQLHTVFAFQQSSIHEKGRRHSIGYIYIGWNNTFISAVFNFSPSGALTYTLSNFF